VRLGDAAGSRSVCRVGEPILAWPVRWATLCGSPRVTARKTETPCLRPPRSLRRRWHRNDDGAAAVADEWVLGKRPAHCAATLAAAAAAAAAAVTATRETLSTAARAGALATFR
jgi:hypothetical protein